MFETFSTYEPLSAVIGVNVKDPKRCVGELNSKISMVPEISVEFVTSVNDSEVSERLDDALGGGRKPSRRLRCKDMKHQRREKTGMDTYHTF